jgi:hypothetical protein
MAATSRRSRLTPKPVTGFGRRAGETAGTSDEAVEAQADVVVPIQSAPLSSEVDTSDAQPTQDSTPKGEVLLAPEDEDSHLRPTAVPEPEVPPTRDTAAHEAPTNNTADEPGSTLGNTSDDSSPDLSGDSVLSQPVDLLSLQLPLLSRSPADNTPGRNTNVHVPREAASRVRSDAAAVREETQALVIWRAVRGVLKDPPGFSALVYAYRETGAEDTDELLGAFILAKRPRKDSDRLVYNPSRNLEFALTHLAEQCDVSKAIFVSLALCHYYHLSPALI